MGLLRWALAGAAGYTIYKWFGPHVTAGQGRELDGLCATFRTREAADIAVEHLVQEYGIDPAFIYVEPVAAENSAGVEASGGDHAAGDHGHAERADAPLHGAIQLTVSVDRASLAALTDALRETGAIEIEVF